jgi:RimJ/RimL family protein N-acetyltransferase
VRIVPSTKAHIEWIEDEIDLKRLPDARGISAVSDTGKLYGVCIMDNWTDGSVQVHIAIDSPLCFKGHIFLREVFNYIFNTADRCVAVGLVNSENHKALRFDKHIGFKEIARVRDGWAYGEDIVILELHRNNCRWIEDK